MRKWQDWSHDQVVLITNCQCWKHMRLVLQWRLCRGVKSVDHWTPSIRWWCGCWGIIRRPRIDAVYRPVYWFHKYRYMWKEEKLSKTYIKIFGELFSLKWILLCQGSERCYNKESLNYSFLHPPFWVIKPCIRIFLKNITEQSRLYRPENLYIM